MGRPRKNTDNEAQIEDPANLLVTAGQLGKILGYSARYVQKMTKEQGLPKSGGHRYKLGEAICWYIDYQTSKSTDNIDLTEARTNLLIAQESKTRMENDVRRGELVELDKVSSELGGLFSMMSNQMLSIGPRCAHDVAGMDKPGTCEFAITKEVKDALRAFVDAAGALLDPGDVPEDHGAATGSER